MKILVVGGGGREHALVRRLADDGAGHELHVAPGNPGMAPLAARHAVAVDDVGGLVALAQTLRAGLVMVGPEAPLALGLVDALQHAGVLVLGPTQAAAQLESSKLFAKEVMQTAGVPTAAYQRVADEAGLRAALGDGPCVLKVDGLAAGKGVVVCSDGAEARTAGMELLRKHGGPLLVEERLAGREVSVLALCDGERAVMLPSAQDHKRLLAGDAGPNTGGMGAVSPGTHHGRLGIDEGALLRKTRDEVMLPVLRVMRARGTPFVGVLYAGLMVAPERGELKVLEFNVRLGDPETQAILRRVQGGLGQALADCARGKVDEGALGVSLDAAVCVVMAAQGYPGTPRVGDAIEGLSSAEAKAHVYVDHAGTRAENDGRVCTAGGRVLGVTGRGMSVAQAAERAYSAAALIRWPGAMLRRDVGRAP